MKKVIVTGGLGFIGSNLINKLIQLGEEVICLDNLSSGRSPYIKKWKDLPKNAQKYINFISYYCDVKISSISTSPKREDTILLENPFKKN